MPVTRSEPTGTPSRFVRPPTAVVVGVVVVSALAWVALFAVNVAQQDMGSAWAMPMTAHWSASQALLMLAMWAVMMVAMMLPSASPMLAAYDRTVRADPLGRPWSVASFALGYLLCWGLFAVLATGLQWFLLANASVDAMGVLRQPWTAAAVLIAAGIYEFTPIKQTMLGRCRAPFGFLATEWRDGRSGALRMGVAHGFSCLVCCWAIMLLLFVLGVMNLWWVLALAGLVAVEKLTRSVVIPRIAGAALIAAGAAVLLFPFLT